MTILVTGVAGFIGYHVAQRLLARGEHVLGIDNLNDYYDPAIKRSRLELLQGHGGFEFRFADIADKQGMSRLFAAEPFQLVIHLAAQAGVRYSLTNPHAYIEANLVGFANILEGCRSSRAKHLVYASSSSVYGLNTQMPFSTAHNVDHPVSLYAATKKSNELMAHVYSHLYGLPTTGLRFFTVYGPWGRPDMAIFKFTKAILSGSSIDVYNHGRMRRDFTYIDDVVEGVLRIADHVPVGEPGWTQEAPSAPSSSSAPYKVYNLGNHKPVELMAFIKSLEGALGRQAILNFLPMQPGDVPETSADVQDFERDTGFSPRTPIDEGIGHFVKWFRDYYGR
jgi:UDP-glucuronate 4-epimerase